MRVWRKGRLMHWWEYKLVQLDCGKQSGYSTQNLKFILPYNPSITLLEIDPTEMKSVHEIILCTLGLLQLNWPIAKIWNQSICSLTSN